MTRLALFALLSSGCSWWNSLCYERWQRCTEDSGNYCEERLRRCLGETK